MEGSFSVIARCVRRAVVELDCYDYDWPLSVGLQKTGEGAGMRRYGDDRQ